MKLIMPCLVQLVFLLSPLTTVGEEYYGIDPSHADIGFTISHLIISKQPRPEDVALTYPLEGGV